MCVFPLFLFLTYLQPHKQDLFERNLAERVDLDVHDALAVHQMAVRTLAVHIRDVRTVGANVLSNASLQ